MQRVSSLSGQAGRRFCWDSPRHIKQHCPSCLCCQPRKTLTLCNICCQGLCAFSFGGGGGKVGLSSPLKHLQKKLNWHLCAEQRWCCSSSKSRAVWQMCGWFLPPLLIHYQQLYSSLVTCLQTKQLVCSPVWGRSEELCSEHLLQQLNWWLGTSKSWALIMTIDWWIQLEEKALWLLQ